MSQNNLPKGVQNSSGTFALWFFLLTCVIFFFIASNTQKDSHKISFKEFMVAIENKKIEQVTFKGNEIFGKFKDEDKIKGKTFTSYGDTQSQIYQEKIDKSGIIPEYEPSESSGLSIFSFILTIVPLLILIGIVYIFIRNSKNGVKFGKMNLNSKHESSTIKFADVAGMDETKAEIMELVEFLKNPNKYTGIGAKIPKGALFCGPSGTGKTMMAKAAANEAGVPFFSISGSEFVEMFVGVGASRVRDMFQQAKKHAPCILFIDEIDAVGKQRSSSGATGGHDERDQTLNQLLVEMDGFDDNTGVIVIAATNRLDILDTALLRPGRFDRKIMVTLPDIHGRTQILKVHARGKKMDPNINFDVIARGTAGMSGADLENLLNEAALMTVRKGLSEISMKLIEEAKDKIIMGVERKTVVIRDDEKKRTAYHEAGHALITASLPYLDTLHKVTIVPRGMALGVTQVIPEDNQISFSKEKIINLIKMLMGGRAAEELIFNEKTTGASDDIKKATNMARRMICEWGMSDKIGPVSIQIQENALDPSHISEETQKEIDDEVQSLLNTCYNETLDLLKSKKDVLEKIANALLEHETCSGEEILALIKT